MAHSPDILTLGSPSFAERREIAAFEQGAPAPHTRPSTWFDEYQVRLGRLQRKQAMDAVIGDMIKAGVGKMVSLGRAPQAARPSFPVSGLPAALA